MPLVVFALAAGLLAGLLLGGSVRRLAAPARLHHAGLLLAGATCVLSTRWIGGAAGAGLLIAGYVLMVGFALRNASVTGMVLVAAGLLANLTVIAVNRGMPVRGLAPEISDGWRHHGERPGDHLVGLADVVPTPFGETISAGDIVLSLGVTTAVVSLMRPRRRPVAETS